MVVDGTALALLIGTMLRNLNQIPIILPPILLALSFHEMAHAWAANRPFVTFESALASW